MKTENVIVVDQSEENEHLTVLIKEYELAASYWDRYEERVSQLLGTGFTVMLAVLGFFVLQERSLPIWVAWGAPMVFVIFYALLIGDMYSGHNFVWICRILSERINKRLPEPALIRFERGYPSATFFSLRRGNYKYRMLYLVFLAVVCALFFSTTLLSFRAIYTWSHLSGTLFLSFYGGLAILELTALSGLFRDLPGAYHDFLEWIASTGRLPRAHELLVQNLKPRSLLPLLIVRPWDTLVKGVGFWYGFAVALCTVGLQPRQLQLINALFGGSTDWSHSDVPVWTMWGLGFLYFFIEEVMLQQSKYLWDDIRDFERDKLLDKNKGRAVASGLISVSSAIRHMAVRWALAILAGFALGGWPLLLLFLIITLHQALYVLWAKPRGKEHPVILLFVISFNILV